jgi:hypothetical protein
MRSVLGRSPRCPAPSLSGSLLSDIDHGATRATMSCGIPSLASMPEELRPEAVEAKVLYPRNPMGGGMMGMMMGGSRMPVLPSAGQRGRPTCPCPCPVRRRGPSAGEREEAKARTCPRNRRRLKVLRSIHSALCQMVGQACGSGKTRAECSAAVQRTAACSRRLERRLPAYADPSRGATVSRSGHRLIRGSHSECEAYEDISTRKRPLHSRSSPRCVRSRPLAPRTGPFRDNFRDNLGDSRVPASCSLVYT